MSPALIQILGSAATAAVLVAVINAVVTRRKLGAEATKIITDAASGMVADLRVENARLSTADHAKSARITGLEDRVDDLEDEQRGWEREREDWLRVLELHAAWDHLAIAKLREVSPAIVLPDPPPLTAPVRYQRKPNK
jgi:hypothetical protein